MLLVTETDQKEISTPSLEEICRITRRVDPINNRIQIPKYWLRFVAKGAIDLPNFLHKMCLCFYVGIKKIEDTTTNNPLSLLWPPSSNNQLWPLRRQIASRRGVVGVGDGVGVGRGSSQILPPPRTFFSFFFFFFRQEHKMRGREHKMRGRISRLGKQTNNGLTTTPFRRIAILAMSGYG